MKLRKIAMYDKVSKCSKNWLTRVSEGMKKGAGLLSKI